MPARGLCHPRALRLRHCWWNGWQIDVGGLRRFGLQQRLGPIADPVEEMLRLDEATGVRARAEYDDRHWVALRHLQECCETVAGLTNEAGLAAAHRNITPREQ